MVAVRSLEISLSSAMSYSPLRAPLPPLPSGSAPSSASLVPAALALALPFAFAAFLGARLPFAFAPDAAFLVCWRAGRARKSSSFAELVSDSASDSDSGSDAAAPSRRSSLPERSESSLASEPACDLRRRDRGSVRRRGQLIFLLLVETDGRPHR